MQFITACSARLRGLRVPLRAALPAVCCFAAAIWAVAPAANGTLRLSSVRAALAAGPDAASVPLAHISDPSQVLDELAQDPVRRALAAEYQLALANAPTKAWRDPATVTVAGLTPSVAASVARSYAILSAGERPRAVARRYSLNFSAVSLKAARTRLRASSPAPVAAPRQYVQWALYDAAMATGVSHGYLWRTASRESSFNPYAAARTSSAAGLFQFIESTWLEAVSRYGGRHGLGGEAAAIAFDRSGRPFVADPRRRTEILALRYNPQLATRLAGEMTREHARVLTSSLGRSPTEGELYAAHFLGIDGAVRLIRTAYTQPWRSAADLFPAAARANRRIFYAGGRPLSCSQVLQRLT